MHVAGFCFQTNDTANNLLGHVRLTKHEGERYQLPYVFRTLLGERSGDWAELLLRWFGTLSPGGEKPTGLYSVRSEISIRVVACLLRMYALCICRSCVCGSFDISIIGTGKEYVHVYMYARARGFLFLDGSRSDRFIWSQLARPLGRMREPLRMDERLSLCLLCLLFFFVIIIVPSACLLLKASMGLVMYVLNSMCAL